MGMFFHSSDAPPERTSDPAVRRANMRRIGRLFAPYKLRLGGVLLLIVLSAGLGVVPAFLLKSVLEAIGRNDTTSLSYNAGGMIAIAVATGVLGVIQTLLSNQVGQRVMHDLRAAVFRHLQRLSLAFFTRTRTGEVQSRISNDIGGVQNVVTNTATSIASNVTTVGATMVGMLVLNWRLALFAFALIPLFVLLTRRVGNERRRIAQTTQETLADISSLVQESLSVSGIILGKRRGRGNELAARFEADAALLSRRIAAWGWPRRADVACALRSDLRIPRPADRHRGEAGRACCRAGRRRRLRSGLVPVRRGLDAPGRLVHSGGGHDDRARRRDRLRQDDARLPRGATLRRQSWKHHDRGRRHP